MTQAKTPYRKLLRAIAEFRRYPFMERAALWEERLSLNQRELEAFFAVPEVDDAPLLAPPKSTLAQQAAPPSVAPPVSKIHDDICLASAVEIAARVRARALSPVAVAAAYLERAEANRHLNAFITLARDRVLADAEQLAKRIAGGEDPGALAGVPVAVKDLMHVRGYPLTGGTRAIDPKVSEFDAEVVARLRAAGAIIIGTANLHELAYGVTSINPHFGRVQNPWAPACIAGGSSGGSAAAVAAGLAAVAVGTDTAGSIRIPAACCGVVGLKPSYDAVSREGVMPLAWSLDHVGPIARSVEDAALMFEVMAGLSAGSIRSSQADDRLRLRIARPVPYFFDLLDAQVRARVDQVIALLVDAGASVADTAIAGVALAPAIQFMTICPEATNAHWRRLLDHGDKLGADVRVRLEIGQFLLGMDYVKAQRLRQRLRRAFLAALDSADVLITPTLAIPAPAADAVTVAIAGTNRPVHSVLTAFTAPFNSTGLPAITLPCGVDQHGPADRCPDRGPARRRRLSPAGRASMRTVN